MRIVAVHVAGQLLVHRTDGSLFKYQPSHPVDKTTVAMLVTDSRVRARCLCLHPCFDEIERVCDHGSAASCDDARSEALVQRSRAV